MKSYVWFVDKHFNGLDVCIFQYTMYIHARLYMIYYHTYYVMYSGTGLKSKNMDHGTYIRWEEKDLYGWN